MFYNHFINPSPQLLQVQGMGFYEKSCDLTVFETFCSMNSVVLNPNLVVDGNLYNGLTSVTCNPLVTYKQGFLDLNRMV